MTHLMEGPIVVVLVLLSGVGLQRMRKSGEVLKEDLRRILMEEEKLGKNEDRVTMKTGRRRET